MIRAESSFVIVIDKDVHHAGEVKAFLLSDGFKVRISKDVPSLLKSNIRIPNVIAVLFDYNNDDDQLSQNLKALKEQFGTDTLMILMHEFSVEALKAAVVAGFNEFLAKPVGRDELYSLLNRKRAGSIPKKISMTIKLEATFLEE